MCSWGSCICAIMHVFPCGHCVATVWPLCGHCVATVGPLGICGFSAHCAFGLAARHDPTDRGDRTSRRDVLHLLRFGRCPASLVLALAGASGGEGKSLFLKPLVGTFGAGSAFESPEKGCFPPFSSARVKNLLLRHWRFQAEVLPWSAQCLLYGGSNVPVNRPQNVLGQLGHANTRAHRRYL